MSIRSLWIYLPLQCFFVQGQTIQLVYQFSEVTTSSGTVAPGQPPQAPGISAGSFSAAGVSSNPNASGRFSFTGWPNGSNDGSDDHSSFTGALSPFSYYEVSLEVLPGYTLSLADISFAVRRSGTGIRNYCVRTNADNFTENLAASTGTNTRLAVLPGDVFLWVNDNTSTASDQKGSLVSFGQQHQSFTGIVHIRFYAWNAEAGSGSFSIDDVTIRGYISDSVKVNSMNEFTNNDCPGSNSGLDRLIDCGWELSAVYDMTGREYPTGDFFSDKRFRIGSCGGFLFLFRKGKNVLSRKIMTDFR